MKKLFLVFAFVLVAFTVAACHKDDKTTKTTENTTTTTTADTTTTTANTAPTISGVADKEVALNDSSFDIKAGITATDDQDGDFASSDIKVTGTVDTTKLGLYYVTYSVTDSGGLTASESATFTVVNALAPTITLPDSNTVLKGDTDWTDLDGVKATDPKDGDITSSIVVSGDTVDTSVPGDYHLIYTVENAGGRITVVNRTVTVLKGTVPTITLPDSNLVDLGSDWTALDGVKANDEVDGDITANIQVTGTVDVNTVGDYNLVYTVTNAAGITVSANRMVFVHAVPATITLPDEYKQIVKGDAFDAMTGVTATDPHDGDITNAVTVDKTVDTSALGKTTLTYTVENSFGLTTTKTRVIEVVATQADLVPLANGDYNFRFATSDLRNTFFAAAEKYLVNNMYAGVPVFANAGYRMYSSRVQLPTETYVPVLGFGSIFGDMAQDQDDSTVTMPNGSAGQAGQYTFRDYETDNPTTFNQWKADDSISSDVYSLFLDSLYAYKFNADKTGFELDPSMASANPTPESPDTINGLTVSKVWNIPIREGLKWAFNKDTDHSGWDTTIDANDFVDTYKYALDHNWFRAVSGGGDFLNKSQEIVGASDYVAAVQADDGTADWSKVGIKLVDNNTIQFRFVSNMSEWNVKYWLSDQVMTPVNMDLLNQVGEDKYGSTPETTAYDGPYILDYYEPDSIVSYVKNPDFHDASEYHYTGYSFSIIKDADVRWSEFQEGHLDVSAVPTASYEYVKNDPNLRFVPGTTTFRLMINGTGSVAKQKELWQGNDNPQGTQNPTGYNYVPKPILADQNFKKAMYFAIDRNKLAYEVLKTSQPQQYLFTDAYLVDPSTGIPFRDTTYGESVGDGLSPDTYGYNPDAAKAYYKAAIQELIDNGTYQAGTAANPTIINLDLDVFSGSQAQALLGAFIKSSFEDLFVDDTNHVKVEVTVTPKDFPDIYYNYMMIGNFDLSIGGISGSTLDAASFLDTYASDNRGGFTLNWGIDTTIPEIKVTYTDPNTNQEKTEMWSFDAIQRALNGDVTVVNGMESDDSGE